MNEMLVKYWNETVKPEDMVYYLGDFSMSFNTARQYVRHLNGRKILITGNHDECSHLHSKYKKNPQLMLDKYHHAGFESILPSLSTEIDGKEVLLHHFPYREVEKPGEHDKAYVVRYLDERQEDKGLTLLHGHTHGTWLKKGNCIDVGVDSWSYHPVSLDQIRQVIADPRQLIRVGEL